MKDVVSLLTAADIEMLPVACLGKGNVRGGEIIVCQSCGCLLAGYVRLVTWSNRGDDRERAGLGELKE